MQKHTRSKGDEQLCYDTNIGKLTPLVELKNDKKREQPERKYAAAYKMAGCSLDSATRPILGNQFRYRKICR